MNNNPFVLKSYVSDEFFCDRAEETQLLKKHIANGRNMKFMTSSLPFGLTSGYEEGLADVVKVSFAHIV
jgi:hypothetical protein